MAGVLVFYVATALAYAPMLRTHAAAMQRPCGAAERMPTAAQLRHGAVPQRHAAIVCRDLPNIDGTGAFKNIQEYPCTLDIKVIGDNEGPFVADIVTLCAENTGMREEDIQVRWRDKGKYRSITLRLRFENADQVYATYAAVDRDPRVRYKL